MAMRYLTPLLLALGLLVASARADELADAAAGAMAHAGHGHGAADPHMRMTAPRTATAADQARYAALLATIRTGLAKYRDVAVARADGFEPFLPDLPQPVYHFTRKLYAFEAAFGFDPLKPTSLLYRREPEGAWTLVGVMYTAPARFTEDELDARVPLGVAAWHQHVNWCVPGPLHRERWAETRDGAPLFGPRSPIATEAGCSAVDGLFLPRIFGWMVHVDAFAPGPEPAA